MIQVAICHLFIARSAKDHHRRTVRRDFKCRTYCDHVLPGARAQSHGSHGSLCTVSAQQTVRQGLTMPPLMCTGWGKKSSCSQRRAASSCRITGMTTHKVLQHWHDRGSVMPTNHIVVVRAHLSPPNIPSISHRGTSPLAVTAAEQDTTLLF